MARTSRSPGAKRRKATRGARSRARQPRIGTTSSAQRALLRAGQGAHPEFELRDDVVERALRTGEHQGLLEDYFGPENYAELRQLSREAAARGVRGGPKVLILPGIMGSKIGIRRPSELVDDVFWFDPVDIAAGGLTQLALGKPASRFGAVGVILLAYLRIKLKLAASGYDADFWPYDWRQSIAGLGGDLARQLRELKGNVDLVAHSMGGLVARSALGQGAECRRLIMLGTPNFGSFAPVMALRGTYPVVRKVGALDLFHKPEDLARDVFSTFPGLTEMLPHAGSFNTVDLYDLNSWPADRLRPQAGILSQVAKVQKGFAAGADNHYLVAGVEQQTPVGLARDPKEGFTYTYSLAGDGTVPLDFARLPGIRSTYYVAESHGSLPNNKLVCRAVLDLLARGLTDALPDVYVPATRAATAEVVPERALRTPMYEGRSGGMLSQNELRHVIDEVASPEARDTAGASAPSGAAAVGAAPAPEPGYQHSFEQIVVGRRRQHRIDLRFALGSITEVNVRALVLGIFRGVTPDGAASAIDRRMGGAVTELSRRRMFSGQVGEIFMMPTGRHPLSAELIAFVGLGDFDRFSPEVLQTAAENVIRTLVNARVEEFATVLFGGGSGEAPASALRNLLIGFFRGLQDADRDHQFRRLILCEQNPGRFVQLKEELYRLSSTDVCAKVELTFDEVALAPPAEQPAESVRVARGPSPVYLIVRQERSGRGSEMVVRSSLLTAGAKATVVSGGRSVKRGEFETLRDKITAEATEDLGALGVELGEMLLADEVNMVLPRFSDRHLVVVHDAALSKVPWEVMAFSTGSAKGDVWFPAARKGLSHRYAVDKLSVAKWLEERLDDRMLNVLLVVNPTEDLEGAEEEGARIRGRLQGQPGVQLDELRNASATRPALLGAFTSGKYDVIHYAGHAAFDEQDPARGGLECAGGTRLTGADLAGLSQLPAVVFFNACEAARVRRARPTRRPTRKEAAQRGRQRLRQLKDSIGVAEAFMLGGVANFLGTYWPVGDAAAKVFAEKLYDALLAGETIGEAIQRGRAAIRPRSKDWANYVFYGDPEFVLKRVQAWA